MPSAMSKDSRRVPYAMGNSVTFFSQTVLFIRKAIHMMMCLKACNSIHLFQGCKLHVSPYSVCLARPCFSSAWHRPWLLFSYQNCLLNKCMEGWWMAWVLLWKPRINLISLLYASSFSILSQKYIFNGLLFDKLLFHFWREYGWEQDGYKFSTFCIPEVLASLHLHITSSHPSSTSER